MPPLPPLLSRRCLEVQGHTVPHWKDLCSGKLLHHSHLSGRHESANKLHRLGFVDSQSLRIVHSESDDDSMFQTVSIKVLKNVISKVGT